MPETDILVDNCGVQNKNNVMIRFLNMIKEGVLLEKNTLHFYIKGHTKMTVTPYLTALRYCNGSKMSLLLRSAVEF